MYPSAARITRPPTRNLGFIVTVAAWPARTAGGLVQVRVAAFLSPIDSLARSLDRWRRALVLSPPGDASNRRGRARPAHRRRSRSSSCRASGHRLLLTSQQMDALDDEIEIE